MSKYHSMVRCAEPGCGETGHYGFDTRKEKRESDIARSQRPPWKCTRHTRPDHLLSKTNLRRSMEVVANKSTRYPDLDDLFWGEGSGFTFGPGFKAYANDFPPGTKLIVTAEIVLPDTAQGGSEA